MIENKNTREMTIIKNKTGLVTALGWIFAVLSIFFYPFVFGLLGVIMGIIASKSGSRTGLPVILASIVFMGIGLIFSGVILNYITHFLGI